MSAPGQDRAWRGWVPSRSGRGTHPLPQLGGEVVEDEVGERLRHGSDVRDVMSHHHVVKGEISRGSKR